MAALASLQENASGEHNVRYGVAVDVDDLATIGVCQTLRPTWPKGSGFRVGPRPVSMDALHNQLSRDIPGEVYVGFCDDMLCVTKGWDKIVAEAVEANPKGVWWWTSTDKRKDFTQMPIVSEGWRRAAGGIFPEYFPYWWGDTWLAEVWALATEGGLKYLPVEFIDAPAKTNNMRDLRFWTDFYFWLQPVRVEEAKRIAAALNLPLTITDVFSKFTSVKNKSFMDRIEEIEANQGDQTEPHEGYKIAKARAEEMMRTNALPQPEQEFSIEDLLTPEVVEILTKHFPEAMPSP